MNAMELQTTLLQRSGLSSSDLTALRPVHRRTGSGLSVGSRTDGVPAFSDVLAALTRAHSGETAAAQERIHEHHFAVSAASRQDAVTASSHTSTEQKAEENNDSLSSTEARRILRNALDSDVISMDLVNALTDKSGEISDNLLDLIFAEDEEEEDKTSTIGIKGDTNEQLTNLLTSATDAKELLSSQSGRELIARMADRSLADIVTAL